MEIKAKKKFGQNFISDENLINKIVDVLGQNENQLIIEIGPGTGALTQKLVNKFSKVLAIEIDEEMEAILNEKISNPNFKLILEDVLKVDFKALIDQEKEFATQQVSLISNMPYYITAEILFRTFNLHDQLTTAVFMMQKEVATRLCANKGENNYNNLSIAAQFYATRKYEFTVNKGMFRPIPKVDSSIVSLTFNQDNLHRVSNDHEFISFVRKMFNNKRKTILNNLASVIEKTSASEILISSQINLQLRPEVLSIDDFILIFNNLEHHRNAN